MNERLRTAWWMTAVGLALVLVLAFTVAGAFRPAPARSGSLIERHRESRDDLAAR